MIRVNSLEKSYGDKKVLKDIEIETEENEIVGIIGPNGAGKSTLVKSLTGQVSFEGEAEVLGKDPIEDSVELREKLGILPEREDPPSFLTCQEYLKFVAETREDEIDVNYWKEKLKLDGKMDNLTRDLSKGERQKLMIVQAFFHDPELVFIDEPLVNLDPEIQRRVKELFKQHKEDGNSLVLCTHVIELAEEVCDRVLILKDGEIVEKVEKIEKLEQKFFENQ